MPVVKTEGGEDYTGATVIEPEKGWAHLPLLATTRSFSLASLSSQTPTFCSLQVLQHSYCHTGFLFPVSIHHDGSQSVLHHPAAERHPG